VDRRNTGLGIALMDRAGQWSASVASGYRKASGLDVHRRARAWTWDFARSMVSLRRKKACFFVSHLMLRGPAGPPFDD
jgi:hypothetical protein